jgi:precorrin-2/cobalt-factor-2 C20-methyltransferase
MRAGRVIGVGVGPGDPELLTFKAARAIERSPVIAYIGARGRASRARQIVAGHVRPGTRELAFAMPMTGEAGDTAPIYDVMAGAIVAELEQGRDVAVLCEGDPLFYGSFIYLLERLQGRFECVVVPGVSAMMASAAIARRPLASGAAVLTVLPATLSEARLEPLARAASRLVVIKVGRHVAKVRAVLRASGHLDGAVLVENVGERDERVRELRKVKDEVVSYFSLVMASRAEPLP